MRILERETIIYLVWLLLVVVWNFGWPHATPIEDVVVSVILFLLAKFAVKKLCK